MNKKNLAKDGNRVSIPAHEAWLYKNKKALDSVRKGLEEARQGKLSKAPEDFSKYIDD